MSSSSILRNAFVTVLSIVSLVACAAGPDGDEEVTDDSSSALANNGGGGGNGLTAGECTSCGCSLVLIEKTDSCRYYKCVCDSEAKAKCALGKAASMTVTVPNGPTLPWRLDRAAATGNAATFSTSP